MSWRQEAKKGVEDCEKPGGAVKRERAEFTIALSQEERDHLLSLLERALRDKQIEVHRTDALEYKEFVQRQEALLQQVLDKVKRS
jgi:hypothetical protein